MGSRLSVLKAVLRKTPMSKDVDIAYVAAQTEKFTGADLTEICQRAAKLGIREAIQRDMEGDDAVPELLPKHFEEAVRQARRSVSDRDLAQYSSFAQNLQQARANVTSGGGSLSTFAFPTSNASREGAATAADDEDEDLYT